MKDICKLTETIRSLLDSQLFAVLSTQKDGQPYGSLVAFASTPDLKHLVFATTRVSRKYGNLISEPRVALVIDSRTNSAMDFSEAVAVTVLGEVSEVKGSEHESLLNLYVCRHPYLKEFTESPTCAFLKVEVGSYYLVSRFQNVQELMIKDSL